MSAKVTSSIPTKSCIILGGNGAVGTTIVRQALANNSFTRVLTLGRRPVSTEGLTNTTVLEQKTVDFDNIKSTLPEESLPQVVFCTLGTTRGHAGSAEAFKKIDQTYVLETARAIHERAPKDPETGLSQVHFVYCSSAGANAKSMALYPKTKGETEVALSEIGFERVSIMSPAFLKIEQPRADGYRMGESIFAKLIPVMDFISERNMTVPVASVGQAMILIGQSATPEVHGVKPTVKTNDLTLTAYYNNGMIHDIIKKANEAAKL